MTKQDLQKELLEKIKPGVKASDLKKKKVKPKSEKDEGYSSEEEKNISRKSQPQSETKPISEISEKDLNSQITETKRLEKIIGDLQAQITSLKKQLQTYKDFKEADLKIKERYKQEIVEYKKTISELTAKIQEQYKSMEDLKNQLKSKGNDSKSSLNGKESNIKTFNCYHCHKQQEISLLVIELPEGKLCQPCWTILRKKTKEQANPTLNTSQLFTCVACDKEKNEVPNYKKVDISYKPLIKGEEYPVCSACSPHVKEYNEDENRKIDIWE